jgi:hypothetical protein
MFMLQLSQKSTMINPRTLLLSLPAVSVVTALRLNVTAVSADRGNSRFECWQIETPFSQSIQNGLVGTATTILGDVTNMTYNVVGSNYDGEFHNAPCNQ